jgi:hypothetical protein
MDYCSMTFQFLRRVAKRGQASPAPTRDHTINAPLKGWVSATNLAKPIPDSATRLDNWFPELDSVRMRKGRLKHATVSVTLPCLSLFTHESSVSVLFGATEDSIYPISTPASPTVPPSADITGQTSGYYSTMQFATAGGTFTMIANGTDPMQHFDGASWAVPAITNVSSSDISHVWGYRNRIFMVEKDTLNAWYLPVDSIAGAASQISFAGVFQKGGTLLSGTTWSFDSAGTGLNTRCVFVSTQGEVAVYEGIDPSSANTWSLVGLYEMGKMQGKNAFLRVAGDVLFATRDGLVNLNNVVNKDRAALSLNAISKPIEPDWKLEAENRTNNWTIVKWPEKNMTIIGLPYLAGRDDFCFVINSESGAWAGPFTSWNVNCCALFAGYVYFGTQAGTVMKAETTGADDGANYTCVYVGQYEGWGIGPKQKVAQLMRATFKASVSFTPQLSVAANFSTTIPSPPSATAIGSADVWDTAIWDTSVWDSSGVQAITSRWKSVSGQGWAMAPVIQITSGSTTAPDGKLITTQVRYSEGAMVT